MKVAVSNIAWTNDEEEQVAKELSDLGIKYVEIAPTKIWDDPTLISQDEALEYVNWWADRGIKIVAFQSMLFSRPDLKIFESESNRKETLAYLSKYIELAGTMGVSRMVFGSPKNRQIGKLGVAEANLIAKEFFSQLGKVAKENGVVFCIEPNAPQYNCDFVVNAKDGLALVRNVSEPGFGLHLDTACMFLAGDTLGESIKESADVLEHFHVSAPMLGAVEPNGEISHTEASEALKKINYKGFVSIEMRPGEPGENAQRVVDAVKYVQGIYG